MLAGVLVAGISLAQTTVKSPTDVQKALGTLNRVVDHTQRLITAGNFARLPHEDQEFKEGLAALSRSIPDDFKVKIKALVDEAQADSQRLANESAEHDSAKLAMIHDAFADSVNRLLGAFPDNVQPASSHR